ncbi:hypothetical protein BDZ97DRAFT_1926035 [Flammula alnicola]|nr:hypothetical protein BDZ97DRAFT_1926035 [Flammula alnicola]
MENIDQEFPFNKFRKIQSTLTRSQSSLLLQIPKRTHTTKCAPIPTETSSDRQVPGMQSATRNASSGNNTSLSFECPAYSEERHDLEQALGRQSRDLAAIMSNRKEYTRSSSSSVEQKDLKTHSVTWHYIYLQTTQTTTNNAILPTDTITLKPPDELKHQSEHIKTQNSKHKTNARLTMTSSNNTNNTTTTTDTDDQRRNMPPTYRLTHRAYHKSGRVRNR